MSSSYAAAPLNVLMEKRRQAATVDMHDAVLEYLSRHIDDPDSAIRSHCFVMKYMSLRALVPDKVWEKDAAVFDALERIALEHAWRITYDPNSVNDLFFNTSPVPRQGALVKMLPTAPESSSDK